MRHWAELSWRCCVCCEPRVIPAGVFSTCSASPQLLLHNKTTLSCCSGSIVDRSVDEGVLKVSTACGDVQRHFHSIFLVICVGRAQMIHSSGTKHFRWSFPEGNICLSSEEEAHKGLHADFVPLLGFCFQVPRNADNLQRAGYYWTHIINTFNGTLH